MTYTMAYPFTTSLKNFDPHVINDTSEALLAMNLYTYLVYFDDKGELYPGLAGDFTFNENSLILKIRNDIKDTNGISLTVDDVVFNLKRILNNKKHTHADLQLLLNTADKETIKKNGNNVILKTNSKAHARFLLEALASCDFPIIPKHSIKGGQFNYKNTAGPYYIEKESPETISLKANTNHIFFTPKMPLSIELKNYIDPSNNVEEDFENGKIDIIPTIQHFNSSLIKKYKNNTKFDTHKTEDIAIFRASTTKKSQNELNQNERIYYLKLIREFIVKSYQLENTYDQLFPSFGSGKLKTKQITSANKIIDRVNKPTKTKEVILQVSPINYNFLINEQKKDDRFHVFKIVQNKKTGHAMPKKQLPDFYISRIDSSFFEDLSLLTYNFKIGAFGNKISFKNWINDYITTESKKERVNKIRKLHYDTIVNGFTLPISKYPYRSIARGIKLNQMKYYAGMDFWKMRVMD